MCNASKTTWVSARVSESLGRYRETVTSGTGSKKLDFNGTKPSGSYSVGDLFLHAEIPRAEWCHFAAECQTAPGRPQVDTQREPQFKESRSLENRI